MAGNGSNQFTLGYIEETPESVRRKIKVSMIVNRLQELVETSDDPQVIAACSKILLDKSLASLSSMDLTVMREEDTDDPARLKATLAMLVEKAGPALLSEILGERAKQLPVTIEQKPVEVGDESAIDTQKQCSTGS